MTTQDPKLKASDDLNQHAESPDGESIEVPDSMEEVAQTLQETLGDIWKNFLDHTPYLLAGVLVLILTFQVLLNFEYRNINWLNLKTLKFFSLL